MELKEFVKKVIIDLDTAITEANLETKRDIRFRDAMRRAGPPRYSRCCTSCTASESEAGSTSSAPKLQLARD